MQNTLNHAIGSIVNHGHFCISGQNHEKVNVRYVRCLHTNWLTTRARYFFRSCASDTVVPTNLLVHHTTVDIIFPFDHARAYIQPSVVLVLHISKAAMDVAEKGNASASDVQPEMSAPDTITPSPPLTRKKLFLVVLCADHSNSRAIN